MLHISQWYSTQSEPSLLCACWISLYPTPRHRSEFTRTIKAGSENQSRPRRVRIRAVGLGEGHWLHQEALSKIKHTMSKAVFISFSLRWNSCVVCRCLYVLGLSSRSLCCWIEGSSKSPRSSPGCLFERFCEEVPGCRSRLPLAPALAF